MRNCQSSYRGIHGHPHRRSDKSFHLVMFSVFASGKVALLPPDVLIRERFFASDEEETVVATQQSSLANTPNLAGFVAPQSSDSHLLSAAKRGDRAAYGQLFE